MAHVGTATQLHSYTNTGIRLQKAREVKVGDVMLQMMQTMQIIQTGQWCTLEYTVARIPKGEKGVNQVNVLSRQMESDIDS
jgi:hypothetical protein